MKILHIYITLERKAGGIATCVPALCRELDANGNIVTLATLNAGMGNSVEAVGETDVIELPSGNIAAFRKRAKYLQKLVKGQDVVHLNGVWTPVNAQLAKVALSFQRKLILSPHASLMQRDINKSLWKGVKKHIAWRIYLEKLLKNVHGLHTTSLNERIELQQIGFNQPTAVIPNGINVSEFEKPVSRQTLKNNYSELKGKNVLLFFSLLKFKKGIHLLVKAWRSIAAQYKDWHLLVVGPDVEGIWKRNQSEWNSEKNNITYAGLLTGQDRLAALWGADLFVLPTYQENFGIVLAEALMARTPIITTNRAPWEFAQKEGFGWVIDPEQKQLEGALERAMSLSDEERYRMGEKGAEYVRRHFDWRQIAKQMEDFYTYILGEGNKPEFVSEGSEGKKKLCLPWRSPASMK